MSILKKAQFTLDSSGVAGFFGGDEAISAMATVHVYEGRKWLGWYNSPGSYTVAKKYGQLAHSRFWDGLFPGVSVDPATLFEFDGIAGPEFRATHSGTIIKNTGHTGHLFMKECEPLKEMEVKGRVTKPMSVTVAKLQHAPEYEIRPARQRRFSSLLAAVPILSSLGACVLCGIYRDWYCLSMIMAGIVTNGLSCYVIGSGTLTFTHPEPAGGCPNGDGFLMTATEVVILLGEEGAVNSVTRGNFSLRFAGEPEYRKIGLCSSLLTAQFLLQLLLIPQGTLFGQIMFLSTLAIAWVYNVYLSSYNKERIQRDILIKDILRKPELKKFKLGTRTAMTVFVLLVLQPRNPKEVLDHLIPNNTNTWQLWKKAVVKKMMNFVFDDADYDGVEPNERKLLETLFGDARGAYDGYCQFSKWLGP